MKSAFCTIVAQNYLPFARTLIQSCRRYHPEVMWYVLIVDGEGPEDQIEGVQWLALDCLNLPSSAQMPFKYDVTELSTAVKPWLFEYLFEKLYSRVIYLDPDIYVTGSLAALFDHLNDHDIVLTPHIDADYPDDGFVPDDSIIMRAGQYNLGFLGVRSSATGRSLVNWLKSKLIGKCKIEVEQGYFVDQRFFDFVPILFPGVFVVTDVGVNVAYWNLHSRHLARCNDRWFCNGHPLSFYHFSGIVSSKVNAISKHCSRYELSDRPDLIELFNEYRSELVRNGYQSAASTRCYAYNSFADGTAITPLVRKYYRDHAEIWSEIEDPFASMQLSRSAVLFSMASPPSPVTLALWKDRGWIALDIGKPLSYGVMILFIARRVMRSGHLSGPHISHIQHDLLPKIEAWTRDALEWVQCRRIELLRALIGLAIYRPSIIFTALYARHVVRLVKRSVGLKG